MRKTLLILLTLISLNGFSQAANRIVNVQSALLNVSPSNLVFIDPTDVNKFYVCNINSVLWPTSQITGLSAYYTASNGIMKTGTDFSIDWDEVMSVQRAGDSIAEINTKINGKVPSNRTITINGTTLDLSANRTWSNVGIELPSQSGQSGKVLSTNGTTPSWITGGGTVTSVGVTSSDFSVSGSPVTTSGNVTLNLNTSGVSSGTYEQVTVNNKGIVTAASNPTKTFNNVPARSIVTTAAAANGWQISSTKDADVSYSVTVTCAVQIGLVTNVEGYVVLEIAATNSTTASDWKEISRVSASQNVSLAVALASTQKSGGSLVGKVPAGWYVRQRSVNVSGTPPILPKVNRRFIDFDYSN